MSIKTFGVVVRSVSVVITVVLVVETSNVVPNLLVVVISAFFLAELIVVVLGFVDDEEAGRVDVDDTLVSFVVVASVLYLIREKCFDKTQRDSTCRLQSEGKVCATSDK